MGRNFLIDVPTLIGADVHRLQLVGKRYDREGSDTRSVHGPNTYLHLEVGNAPGNSDFGRAHRFAYEYLPDIPATMKTRSGQPLFHWDNLPVLSSPPPCHGPLRNLFLDVEEMVGPGGLLVSAVLVPKRHNGPPPGWNPNPVEVPNPWVPPTEPPPMPIDPMTGEPLYPEDQWPPDGWDAKPDWWDDTIIIEPGPRPTEHFGPDAFVHCLLARDPRLPADLADPAAQAREYLRGAPPTMRRADGGPLHVFAGNRVLAEPEPDEPPPEVARP